jgi:hypothetical protein
MAIQTEITRISTAKADIKTAIEAKGVTVPSSTKLDGYATLVNNIPSGGGIEGDIMNPNSIYASFYNIDTYAMDAPFWGSNSSNKDMAKTWVSGDPFEMQFLAKLGDSYSITTSNIVNLSVSPKTITGTFTQSDEVLDGGTTSFNPKRYYKEIYSELSITDTSKPASMMVSVTIGNKTRGFRIVLVEDNSWY